MEEIALRTVVKNGLLWVLISCSLFLVLLIINTVLLLPLNFVLGFTNLFYFVAFGYSVVNLGNFLNLWKKSSLNTESLRIVKLEDLKEWYKKIKLFVVIYFIVFYIYCGLVYYAGIWFTANFGYNIGVIGVFAFFVIDNFFYQIKWYLSISGLIIGVIVLFYFLIKERKLKIEEKLILEMSINPLIPHFI